MKGGEGGGGLHCVQQMCVGILFLIVKQGGEVGGGGVIFSMAFLPVRMALFMHVTVQAATEGQAQPSIPDDPVTLAAGHRSLPSRHA